LKSGGLSHKEIDTLPMMIEKVIKENNLIPKVHEDFILDSANKRGSWFQRVFTPVSKPVVSMVFAEFVATSQEMADLGEKRKEKNFGQHCTWCGYRALCSAELRGHDVDFIKEKEFIRDQDVIDDEEND